MTRRPVIGICAAHEPARWSFWDQPAALVPASYLDSLDGAGGVPVALPPSESLTAELDHVLSLVDGVMVIGGADVDPAFYGQKRQDVTETVYPHRDAFELAVTRRAIALDVPFLGICRGLQILNVARGGTLHQDIASGNEMSIHRRRLGGFEGTDHEIDIEQSSTLHAVIGMTTTVAHCHHHQAVDVVGDGLVVSARAVADGVIEALELPTRRFVVGVQWHPEADAESRVIGGLVEACRA